MNNFGLERYGEAVVYGGFMILNIYSKGRYPADALSNFAMHQFSFDGFEDIPCMEAFLQSLKFADVEEQKKVLYLSAKDAKEAGTKQGWDKTLYWKGKAIDRFSKEYMELVWKAYLELYKNDEFRKALKSSGHKILLHTIGRTFRHSTVLTWWEFTGILTRLRRKMYQDNTKV